MLLPQEKSLCKNDQKIIVSKDKGSSRRHRAINTGQQYYMRQYRLDGDIVRHQKCCDFLLLNDTLKNAYFIELKGGNIHDAVTQLEAGEQICRAELSGYELYYRIICSKVRTHNVQKNVFRKFKEKCGSRLICAENSLEEKM